MQGTWVQSLVRELRSHMPWGNEDRQPQLMSPCTTVKSLREAGRPHTLQLRHDMVKSVNIYFFKCQCSSDQNVVQVQTVSGQGLFPFCSNPQQGLLPTCMFLTPACTSTFCPPSVSQAATPWPLAAQGTLDWGNRPPWALEVNLGHLGRVSSPGYQEGGLDKAKHGHGCRPWLGFSLGPDHVSPQGCWETRAGVTKGQGPLAWVSRCHWITLAH